MSLDSKGTGVPLLEVADITIRFGGVIALEDLSFDVRRGELFAVIGPNGAGKSTLFNCVSGLFRPTGSIRLNGEELIGMRPWTVAARGVARTFQNLGLFDSLDVVENLMVGRHTCMQGGVLSGIVRFGPTRRSEAPAWARCHEIIDLLDLDEYASTPVAFLPYGIRKRVELGKALAMDPSLLLLDEPVAGMNRDETERMIAYIATVRRELELSIILIEHDVAMVLRIADRVLALDFGRAIALGSSEEVRRHPKVIEAYLGGAGEEPPVSTGSPKGKENL